MIINRMMEGQLRAMQHEAIGQCRVALQSISDDGVAEPLRMSRVDAQLMGTARQRCEADASFISIRGSISIQHQPIGHAQFTMHRIQNLPRSIVEVYAEGQLDMAGITGDVTLHQRLIGLGNLPLLELTRQIAMSIGSEAEDHEPRRLHVESMGS